MYLPLTTVAGVNLRGVRERLLACTTVAQVCHFPLGQNPKQGEKPFNKTSNNTPRVNHGGQNGKMPGKDMKDKTPSKKSSDDKKGAPRANMVSDKEHVLAAKRYAELHKRLGRIFFGKAKGKKKPSPW